MDIKSLIHTEPLKDKGLWLAVLSPLIVLGAKVLGLNVDAETAGLLLGPIMTLILGSKVKQAMVAKEVVSSGLLEKLADIEHQLEAVQAGKKEEVKNEG